MSEETTTLSDECVVPWRLGFYLGVGVDCLTGATMNSALEEFRTDFTATPEMVSTRDACHLCTDMESTSRAFATYESYPSQAYNIAPLHDVVAAHALDRMIYSPTTLSVVLRRDIRSSPSPASDGYRLTPHAVETLELRGASAFRELFGDYFVSEVQVGSSFEAVLTYMCATPGARTALIQRLQTVIEARSESNSSIPVFLPLIQEGRISLHIVMKGVRFGRNIGNSVTIRTDIAHSVGVADQIRVHLESFNQRILPTSVAAYLRSYTAIVGGAQISPTLPVPLRVFGELEQLRRLLRGCFVTSGTLLSFGPNETQQHLQMRIRALQENSSMLQPQLASQGDLRQSLLHEARDVGNEISRFNLAYDIWRQCYYFRKSPANRRAATSTPGVTWRIGITDGDGEGEIECHRIVISVSKCPLFLPWRRALRSAEVTGGELSLFNANDDRPQRIIGCRIVSRFGRGICQVSDNFLLSTWQRSLPIVLSSGFLRRDRWEIEVWVSKNPYLDALAQLPPS
ncbi:hypothetical protein EXIGLDRAFT_498282 [Exidia glandulosa HHB12029]|uniref:Uncharacterized protein n=1 Tax=Exidia glandulosa HHB12029 TaxID=1314781 RepID=A0A166N8C9_EXIGL|nr:hypothetical protein EXIGLDRAFT_498282 [Exidia glandulosa HHB12029]